MPSYCLLLFLLVATISILEPPLAESFQWDLPISSLRWPKCQICLQAKKQSPDAVAKRGNRNSSSFQKWKKLNQEIMRLPKSENVLEFFMAKGGITADSPFNHVNYCTMLHRIAKMASYWDKDERVQPSDKIASVSSDPRFALLLSCIGEKLSRDDDKFGSRDMASLMWGLAKLKITSTRHSSFAENEQFADDQTVQRNLRKSLGVTDIEHLETPSSALKRDLVKAAHDEEYKKGIGWMHSQRELGSSIIDALSTLVVERVDFLNPQELANCLWAYSTVGRLDEKFMEAVLPKLTACDLYYYNSESNTRNAIKPQELSNSIWALSAVKYRSIQQKDFLHFVARSLEEGNFSSQFKPQELSNICWGIAKLRKKRIDERENYFGLDGGEVGEVEEGGSGEEDELEDNNIRRILRVAMRLFNVQQAKPQEVTNMVWSLATVGWNTMGGDEEETDTKMCDDFCKLVATSRAQTLGRSGFTSQEMNNLAWSFAKLNYEGEGMIELFNAIASQFKKKTDQFSTLDMSVISWSFATLKFGDLDIFERIAQKLTKESACNYRPQECSNIIWSLASMRCLHQSINMLDADEEKICSTIHTMFNDKGSSNVFIEAYDAVAEELMKRPDSFKDQELKDVIWSFGKTLFRHPKLFKSTAAYLLEDEPARITSFSIQSTSNIVWSYAKLVRVATQDPNYRSDTVRDSIDNTEISAGKLGSFEFALMDYGDKLLLNFFQTISRKFLTEDLKSFTTQDLSNILWSYGVFGMLHKGVFDSFAAEIKRRMNLFNEEERRAEFSMTFPTTRAPLVFSTQEIMNIMWSYSTTNHQSPIAREMFKATVPYIASKITASTILKQGHFTTQELINILFSFCVFELYPEVIFRNAWELLGLNIADYEASRYEADYEAKKGVSSAAADSPSKKTMSKQTIMAAMQVHLCVRNEAGFDLTIPKNFASYYGNQSLSTSKMQDAVAQTCAKAGFDFVAEYIVANGDSEYPGRNFLSMDIADVGRKIAIEVDGPAHYINVIDEHEIRMKSEADGPTGDRNIDKQSSNMKFNMYRDVSGATFLKHRMLCHEGWEVIHVPFFIWAKLLGEEERMQYVTEDLFGEFIEGM